MANAKVTLNGVTLIDLTSDTVTASDILQGKVAHASDGSTIIGTYVPTTASLTTGSINPTESSQHITPPTGYDGFEYVDVTAVPSNYVGSNVPRKSSSDLSASGAVVSVPSGYYTAAASTAIAAGSFSALPVTTTPAIGTISINSSTGVITVARSSHIISNAIQANATQAGYISANTSSKNDLTVGASSTTYALSTLSATTYTPSSATQTIAAGVYLTGSQTIEPIPIGVIEHRLILPEGLIGV